MERGTRGEEAGAAPRRGGVQCDLAFDAIAAFLSARGSFREVRRVSRLAARETTNKPPGPAARLAGRLLTPSAAGHAYLALICRFSTVLTTR